MLRANSLAAHGLAVLGIALATLVRFALEPFAAGIVPYATYFPAVLIVTFLGGTAAGISALVLGGLSGWFFFVPPYFALGVPSRAEAISLALYALASGLLVAAAAALRDRTERLEAAREQLIAALAASGAGTWRWDIRHDTREWDEAHASLVGLPPGRTVKTGAELLALVHPGDRERVAEAMRRSAEAGADFEAEFRVLDPGGGQRWLYSRGKLVRDPAGRPAYVTGASVDVTRRRFAEEQRQLLLKELNHRVRNNLQVTAGLLHMQTSQAQDPVCREHLEKAKQRIMVIAELHAQLYKGDQVHGTLDFGSYLRELCANLESLMVEDSRVAVTVDAEPARLDLDRAVPLGLAVNELVTNAVRHAYPEGASGEVQVRFHRRDGGYLLSVGDSGRGLPGDLDRRSGGLGMRLVKGFVRQVGGSLEIRPRPGARFDIWIPA